MRRNAYPVYKYVSNKCNGSQRGTWSRTFGYPDFWLPRHLVTRTFGHPDFWLPGFLATQTFGHPRTFGHPDNWPPAPLAHNWLPGHLVTRIFGYSDIWLPRYLAIQTFGYPDIWLPGYLAIQTFGYPDIRSIYNFILYCRKQPTHYIIRQSKNILRGMCCAAMLNSALCSVSRTATGSNAPHDVSEQGAHLAASRTADSPTRPCG